MPTTTTSDDPFDGLRKHFNKCDTCGSIHHADSMHACRQQDDPLAGNPTRARRAFGRQLVVEFPPDLPVVTAAKYSAQHPYHAARHLDDGDAPTPPTHCEAALDQVGADHEWKLTTRDAAEARDRAPCTTCFDLRELLERYREQGVAPPHPDEIRVGGDGE